MHGFFIYQPPKPHADKYIKKPNKSMEQIRITPNELSFYHHVEQANLPIVDQKGRVYYIHSIDEYGRYCFVNLSSTPCYDEDDLDLINAPYIKVKI